MARVSPRNYNDLGFFVQSEDTVGCTGGRDDLLRFGLSLTVKAVLGSAVHASHYKLVMTDRTYFVGLVNIKYKDIYVTKHELDVLEGYVPIPQFCEFGFRLEALPPPVYHNLGLPYPLVIRFGNTFQEPLPVGATDLGDEPFLWYRNWLMPGTGKLKGPTRRVTLRETLQRPVFPPRAGWYTLPNEPDPDTVVPDAVEPIVPH